MDIRKVKLGAKITFYNGIYMILFGTYLTIFSNLNMTQNFNTFSQLWGFFQRYNPQIALLFYLYNLIAGALLISQGITISFLSDFIIKRKDKMTWVILFISGIIAWASVLTITIIMQNLILIIISFIGWLIFTIGMLIPIKYYLQKQYREY